MAYSLTADFTDKVAVVTGASRGLGKAIARDLARCGATVICVARSVEKLEATAAEISEAGGKAVVMACDVSDREAIDKLIDDVAEQQGKIDILVNNAGITRDNLLLGMSDEEFDDVINTNLRGAFHFARAAIRHMIRSRFGRIINMASVSGIIGNPGQCNYSASKAGLIGLTRSLSREVAKRKVTVNAVAPGFIESDMTRELADKVGEKVIQEKVKASIPIQKLGQPEDISAAVIYLASDAANYVTGQVLVVDGGMTG